jgi:iron complex outermembrane recepter protein
MIMLLGTRSQFRQSSSRVLWVLILTAALALKASWSCAIDFSRQVAFDIPAQPLSSALVQFADQAHVQFTAPGTSLDGLRSEGVHGRYVPINALAVLLRRTGLRCRIVDQGTVAIMKADAVVSAPTTSDPGSSAGKEGKTPSSARFRLARAAQDAAQSAASLTPGAGDPGRRPRPGLQEVVVTATRRAENILTVPVAVSALTGAEIASRHVETAVDLANYVPSLSVSSGVDRDDYIFAIRGMGPTGGSGPGAVLGGGGTGVVTYFADVPTSGAGPGLFYDLQNVQVAKGPQGTLFGKNTTGGVVLFVPNEPKNELDGYLDLGSGDYALKTATGVVNVPVVSDRLLVRLAGQALERKGFTIDRGPIYPGKDYDNRKYWSVRLSVIARPIDALENYTILSALHSDENGDGYVLSAVNPAGPFASLLLPFMSQQMAAGIRSTALSDNEVDKRYNYGIINRTTWSASDGIQVKNIFSYQVQKWRNGNDIDGSPYVLDDLVAPRSGSWHTQVGTYTEEPQVQGTALHGKLKYTAGAYYEDGHNIAVQPYEVDVALGNFVIMQPNQTNSERSRGVYGQTTYRLDGIARSLSKFALTTGYRYTWDEYGYGITAYSPSIGDACLTTAGAYPASNCLFNASGRSSGSSWTLGLEYHPQSRTLIYLRSGRGYVPGGFNPSLAFSPGGIALPEFRFAPESVVDVELGTKSEFELAGMPIEVDADVFNSDFRNIQRLVSETLPGGVESNFTANASAARIEGLELQATAAPSSQLNVTVAYSYNDGKYTDINPAAAPSLVGIPFAYLPRNKVSGTLGYTLPFGGAIGEVTLDASYAYQSRYFDAPTVQPLDYISGYGVLNGRIEWRDVLRFPLDISAFVTNATDKAYRVGQYSNYITDGRITSFYGEPRMFGADVRYRFGASR